MRLLQAGLECLKQFSLSHDAKCFTRSMYHSTFLPLCERAVYVQETGILLPAPDRGSMARPGRANHSPGIFAESMSGALTTPVLRKPLAAAKHGRIVRKARVAGQDRHRILAAVRSATEIAAGLVPTRNSALVVRHNVRCKQWSVLLCR